MTILIGGVSESAQCVCVRGGILCAPLNSMVCSMLCFSMHSVSSFPVFVFWITGTRLAPPDVKET